MLSIPLKKHTFVKRIFHPIVILFYKVKKKISFFLSSFLSFEVASKENSRLLVSKHFKLKKNILNLFYKINQMIHSQKCKYTLIKLT